MFDADTPTMEPQGPPGLMSTFLILFVLPGVVLLEVPEHNEK